MIESSQFCLNRFELPVLMQVIRQGFNTVAKSVAAAGAGHDTSDVDRIDFE